MIEKIVILFALVFLGERISSRLGQPSVLATVIIGIALGPSFLNMISEEEISLLSQMGAVLLLFVVGIESEVHEIFNKNNFLIAIGGVAVPFVFGYIASFLIPIENVWERVFLGIILVATSVGITAKMLQEMGLMNTKMGSTIIGAAVVDDILGIIVLSAGLASSSSGTVSIEPIARTIVVSIVFIAVSIGIIGKIAAHSLHLLESKFGMEFKEVSILPLFIIALSMAWISEAVGLSMIIG
ncbi:MAG: cation:proton antiporter, partial [Candidatus Aenigmarchaeota archaeon]|nr:cation:proton antiporter [Candidatus Aenigmarchaeota archaeon]